VTNRATPSNGPAEITDASIQLPGQLSEAERDAYESELQRVRISEAARMQAKQERINRESAGLLVTPSQRLDDMFATEPQGAEWLIDGLLQDRGSVLLSAQYKSGKSTLAMNVVHALTTGKPFLGSFAVPEPLRVAYYDLELGFRTARKWLMDIQPDPAMATYTDLKGRGGELDIRSESRFNAMVEQLRKDRIDVIVVDPISAVTAACGIDENGNAEVRPLLDRFDAVVAEAGCRGVVIVHHAGHENKNRARGASAFGDWATALWTLQRDGDGPSKLSAKGRDVHLVKSTLVYDDETRLLTREWGSSELAAEYFLSKRSGQLTAAEVMADLEVTKPTAIKRLEAAEGWEIVQGAQGFSPAIWECSEPFAPLRDPWS
jgi:AAA domain